MFPPPPGPGGASYNGAKSAVHPMALAMRQEINRSDDETFRKNLHIIELAPPYVATDLDIEFRDNFKGGHPPMPLKDFIDDAMDEFGKVDENGKPLKEIAVGFSELGVSLWRGSIGKKMEEMGFGCGRL